MNPEIEKGYKEAESFARSHYENFPVISFLINKELRKHVAVIYWFARTADDIADEGVLEDAQKIAELDNFRDYFTGILNGKPGSFIEEALVNTIKEKNLNVQLFYDLISAFRQDLVKKKYKDFTELLDYCSRSANPVGRLLLGLHEVHAPEAQEYSDQICSALQLINFYQDTSIDIKNGRLYYPLDELEQFGIIESLFDLNENNLNLQRLLKYSLERTEKMLKEGKKLLPYLPLRLRYEIKWTILGGLTIIEKIRANGCNVFVRPKLSGLDLTMLLLKSFI